MANQSDRIHNAIYAAISGFSFPIVSYDADTGLRSTSEVDGVSAQTILIREASSAFEPAAGFRRTPRVRERLDWQWEADLAFDVQVSLELFEETYTQTPLFLGRTADLDQQVTITLDRVTYVHPPEHASSSGTRATLTLTASLSRK